MNGNSLVVKSSARVKVFIYLNKNNNKLVIHPARLNG